MNKTRLALLFLAMSFAASSAYAQVINFDDLPSFTQISNGYAGLNWEHFAVVDVVDNNSSMLGMMGIPYRNGIVSSPNVAYNGWATPGTFSSGTAFNLVSGYFTAVWSGGTFTATANTGATLTQAINTSTPTLISFNWNNVNSVTFTPNGGSQFALDNLMVTAVPEPEEYGMMLLGFGMVGYQIKRKRKQKMAALTAA